NLPHRTGIGRLAKDLYKRTGHTGGWLVSAVYYPRKYPDLLCSFQALGEKVLERYQLQFVGRLCDPRQGEDGLFWWRLRLRQPFWGCRKSLFLNRLLYWRHRSLQAGVFYGTEPHFTFRRLAGVWRHWSKADDSHALRDF